MTTPEQVLFLFFLLWLRFLAFLSPTCLSFLAMSSSHPSHPSPPFFERSCMQDLGKTSTRRREVSRKNERTTLDGRIDTSTFTARDKTFLFSMVSWTSPFLSHFYLLSLLYHLPVFSHISFTRLIWSIPASCVISAFLLGPNTDPRRFCERWALPPRLTVPAFLRAGQFVLFFRAAHSLLVCFLFVFLPLPSSFSLSRPLLFIHLFTSCFVLVILSITNIIYTSYYCRCEIAF